MTNRLYIAARAPRPGFTKTRLGRVVGHDNAASIYRAFLRDLAARFSSAPFDVGWYITPPDAWPEILPCVELDARQSVVIPQPAGDWTSRQRALFAGMTARNEDRTILIASDSPHLPIEIISAAFDLLRDRDLVFGPVHDGGYYLIGMRSPQAAAVLDGVPMSTGDVLFQLARQAGSLGLSVGQVESTFDIDEYQDLEQLGPLAFQRADLAATRRALTVLGLSTGGHASPALMLTGIEGDR